MAENQLINGKDEENGYDNPTLIDNNIKTSVIFVRPSTTQTEPSQDPSTVIYYEPKRPAEEHKEAESESSSDSIEVLHLEDVTKWHPTKGECVQTGADQNDNGVSKLKQKISKKDAKKELDRRKSINVFEEQYSLSEMLESPNSEISVIDPRRDLLRFLFSPPPKDVVVKCQLYKTNKNDKTLLFTKFIFSLELSDADENQKRELLILMAARSRKKSKTVNYVISTDVSEMSSNSSALIGKLRGNFLGTKFVFYRIDRPRSANNMNNEGQDNSEDSGSEVDTASSTPKSKHFKAIGVAFFKGASMMAHKSREISVAIPSWNEKEETYTTDVQLPADKSELTESEDTFVFENIEPKYDKNIKCFTLDFGGRAKKTSVKNFALRRKIGDYDRRVYQFGKCKDHYIIDFTYPLCAFQAFVIGLSCCHRKFAAD